MARIYDPWGLSAASSQGSFAEEEKEQRRPWLDPTLLMGQGLFTPPQFAEYTPQAMTFQWPDFSAAMVGAGGVPSGSLSTSGGGGGVGGGLQNLISGLRTASEISSLGGTIGTGLSKLSGAIFGPAGAGASAPGIGVGMEAGTTGIMEAAMAANAAAGAGAAGAGLAGASGVAAWPTFAELGLEFPALGPLSEGAAGFLGIPGLTAGSASLALMPLAIPSIGKLIDDLTGGPSDEQVTQEHAQWLGANPSEIPRILAYLEDKGAGLATEVPGTPGGSGASWSRVLSDYFGYGPELTAAYKRVYEQQGQQVNELRRQAEDLLESVGYEREVAYQFFGDPQTNVNDVQAARRALSTAQEWVQRRNEPPSR